MGNLLGCIEEVPDLQRLEYDMTPLNSSPVPIIWLVGPNGSGRSIQASILSERVGFQVIDLRELIKSESKKETDRGKLIKDFEKSARKIPDVSIRYSLMK
ncbi:uncharacterized protein LOC108743643 [Agrilus planipennis]|uniref:Uncharacterized protein LOC108743643 n=1 Tax=Agrilus planipennis TaxID=224129 RepID=A0A1W4XPN2_AGRPL|nr:uncharacterized protein LOC108743643 [Agrilus planipennis]